MRIVTLKKDTSLLALASCSGTTEAELMEINGLERRSSLPRGMSLILPSKDEKPKKGLELFVSYSAAAADSAASAAVCSAGIFAPGEHAEPRHTLPLLALSNTDAGGFVSPAMAHELLFDEKKADDSIKALVAKLEGEAWGGLILDMEYLFPFDKAPYTDFVRKLEKSVHRSGCWLIVSVPASAVLTPHSRSGAAYDIADLAAVSERLILMPDEAWDGENLERCLRQLEKLMPLGKLLLGVKAHGLVRCASRENPLPPAAAHNLALSLRAGIHRKNDFAPAEFDFTDASGLRCRASYSDALWLRSLFEMLQRFEAAGIFCPGLSSLCPGAKFIFDSLFYPQKLI